MNDSTKNCDAQDVREQSCDIPKEKAHCAHSPEFAPIITIRCHAGLSGDILLAGFALLNLEKMGLSPDGPQAHAWLTGLLNGVIPDLGEKVKIARHEVNGIGGWQARIELPHCHEHRNLGDIKAIIEKAAMSVKAKQMASDCFSLLAGCEAEIHGKKPEDVHFHEVGALDSILDICGVCEIYAQLAPETLKVSALPLADGHIDCEHGVLPAPAPATLALLKGVPVIPFAGVSDAGELVTPTAIALLKSLGADFGPWPAFTFSHSVIIYGQKVFSGAPNGAIFAIGTAQRCAHHPHSH